MRLDREDENVDGDGDEGVAMCSEMDIAGAEMEDACGRDSWDWCHGGLGQGGLGIVGLEMPWEGDEAVLRD